MKYLLILCLALAAPETAKAGDCMIEMNGKCYASRSGMIEYARIEDDIAIVHYADSFGPPEPACAVLLKLWGDPVKEDHWGDPESVRGVPCHDADGGGGR